MKRILFLPPLERRSLPGWYRCGRASLMDAGGGWSPETQETALVYIPVDPLLHT